MEFAANRNRSKDGYVQRLARAAVLVHGTPLRKFALGKKVPGKRQKVPRQLDDSNRRPTMNL
jgi:hypothetical protein